LSGGIASDGPDGRTAVGVFTGQKLMELRKQTLPTRSNGRFAVALFCVFALAIVIRLGHLASIRSAPFFDLPTGDAKVYDIWARQIVAGDWLGSKVFYHPPLYAYFLAVIYKLFGTAPVFVRLCHSVIGSFSCVLLACAGRRFFSNKVGIIAGVLLALYAPAVFFDTLLHKTVLATFFLCVLLYLLSILTDKPQSRLLWLLGGVTLACLVLTRENAIIFVFGILVWLFVHFSRLRRRLFAPALVFVIGLAVVLLPVAVRNRAVGGEFHLTTSNFGRNLYVGNNENADGCYKPLVFGRGHPMYELADDTRLAEQALGKKLTPAEVSGYWASLAFGYIKSQPFDWLRLMFRKLLLLLNATEIGDTEDLYSYAQWSLPLRLAGFLLHFGVIAPLAVLGVIITWNKRNRLWLLYLLPVLYGLSVLVFYIFGRYRYPLVPFAILFAAAVPAQLRQLVRAKSLSRVGWAVVPLLALVLFCNWPTIPKDAMRATTYSNTAGELMLLGRTDRAIESYRAALDARPDYPAAHNNIAATLESVGRVDEALAHYRMALQLKPDFFDAHLNLARALSDLGNLSQAASHYRRALELAGDDIQLRNDVAAALEQLRQAAQQDPNSPQGHYNLANQLKSQGRFEQAIAHYRIAARLKPDDPDIHNNLGNALRLQGKFNEAIDCYRQAVRLDPDYVTARINLADTLAKSGRPAEALEYFSWAAQLAPDSPLPLVGMARLLATTSDTQIRDLAQAVNFAERAAELTDYKNPSVLDTLARVYAAAGRLDKAVATARAGLKLATTAGDEDMKNYFLDQIKLFNSDPQR